MLDLTLIGENFLGNRPSRLGTEAFRAENRSAGTALLPDFFNATEEEVRQAARLAVQASLPYSETSAEKRAQFLEEIAAQIEGLGDALLERASQESALTIARLTGERGRTCGQLRMFAALLRDGTWRDARIDTADPERKAGPKPDLRRMLVALGPVAVFGASNFPLAFSVAGGDTASALAAGCPVVVKAHPAHPGTSELTARAVLAAAAKCGMPEGVFSMVHGGAEVGRKLVLQPEIEAVGFTGSQRAGRGLFDLAATRERPIPVYAEMGSVNPIFMLPGAITSGGEALAQKYADSLSLGAGQFCTNPGILVGLAGDAFDGFLRTVADSLGKVSPATMLTSAIQCKFDEGIQSWKGRGELETVLASDNSSGALPSLFATSANHFLKNPELAEELFGPAAIAVRCDSFEQMHEVCRALIGQLTATVHYAETDREEAARLYPELARIAGRVVANGFPTGVEVNPSMQHGGPYPASTDSRTTSVGTAAIYRFARPVSFQAAEDAFLPDELKNSNPLGILRLVNGVLTRDPIL